MRVRKARDFDFGPPAQQIGHLLAYQHHALSADVLDDHSCPADKL
jgi:hypothetical protein